jgi:hypothetical protein
MIILGFITRGQETFEWRSSICLGMTGAHIGSLKPNLGHSDGVRPYRNHSGYPTVEEALVSVEYLFPASQPRNLFQGCESSFSYENNFMVGLWTGWCLISTYIWWQFSSAWTAQRTLTRRLMTTVKPATFIPILWHRVVFDRKYQLTWCVRVHRIRSTLATAFQCWLSARTWQETATGTESRERQNQLRTKRLLDTDSGAKIGIRLGDCQVGWWRASKLPHCGAFVRRGAWRRITLAPIRDIEELVTGRVYTSCNDQDWEGERKAISFAKILDKIHLPVVPLCILRCGRIYVRDNVLSADTLGADTYLMLGYRDMLVLGTHRC